MGNLYRVLHDRLSKTVTGVRTTRTNHQRVSFFYMGRPVTGLRPAEARHWLGRLDAAGRLRTGAESLPRGSHPARCHGPGTWDYRVTNASPPPWELEMSVFIVRRPPFEQGLLERNVTRAGIQVL